MTSSHVDPVSTVFKPIGPQSRSTVLVARNRGNENKPTLLEPISENSILEGLQEMSGGVYEDPQNQSVGDEREFYCSKL